MKIGNILIQKLSEIFLQSKPKSTNEEWWYTIIISLHLVNWNISDSIYSFCHICHFILLDLGIEYCRAQTCVLYILCIFLLPWYMTMYTKMAFKETRMLFETELFIVNYDIVIRFSYIRTIFMSIWNHFRDNQYTRDF